MISRHWKRTVLASILALSLFLTACGASSFANQLRVVLSAGAPVLTVLVQQYKITESFRLKLVTDLNEEAEYVSTLGTCLDGAADSKPAKFKCIQVFEGQTRPVLERNFKTNQTVRFIADDIEAVIQAAILFYGGTPSGIQRDATTGDVTEKEIKVRIEKLKKDLEQAPPAPVAAVPCTKQPRVTSDPAEAIRLQIPLVREGEQGRTRPANVDPCP